MRQVMLVAFSCLTLSLLSGCTVVDPVYNHQMGGFPIYSSVKKVSDVAEKKVVKTESVQS